MQVNFQLKPTRKIQVDDPQDFKSTKLEDAEIIWDIDKNKNLKDITISFKGINNIENPSGVILTTNDELDEKAFKIAMYIANKIFLITGIDEINPESVLYNSPSVIPENEREKEILEKNKKQGFRIIPASCNVVKSFKLEKFGEDIKYSKAITLYAEAKRTKSPFQKYELLYKVIEYFFPNKKGEKIDKAVSDYCKQYDPIYGSKDFMIAFRRLRNRCIHPDHKKHANPEDLASVREVVDMVPKIEKLVKLLLEHPRF